MKIKGYDISIKFENASNKRTYSIRLNNSTLKVPQKLLSFLVDNYLRIYNDKNVKMS